MRFFRGISVPASETKPTIAEIEKIGLVKEQGKWKTEHFHPGPLEPLFVKTDLSTEDTRPSEADKMAAVCACGDVDGASYYAWKHNKTDAHDTPILIEFEAPRSVAAIDGKDFLYTVFQMGNPETARDVLKYCFGEAILRYADKAWSSDISNFRIAMCDLATHDPLVIEAHHANQNVLAGRSRTLFRSAFTVALPVPHKEIVSVYSPAQPPNFSTPDFRFDEILRFEG
jgi:hypothetical protein